MNITGAVLEYAGADQPYVASTPIKVSTLVLEPPAENELLVRIFAAGVCYSYPSVVNNDRHSSLPMLLGHDATGIVERVGSPISRFNVGDHVVATFLPRCGECPECKSQGKIPCQA